MFKTYPIIHAYRSFLFSEVFILVLSKINAPLCVDGPIKNTIGIPKALDAAKKARPCKGMHLLSHAKLGKLSNRDNWIHKMENVDFLKSLKCNPGIPFLTTCQMLFAKAKSSHLSVSKMGLTDHI